MDKILFVVLAITVVRVATFATGVTTTNKQQYLEELKAMVSIPEVKRKTIDIGKDTLKAVISPLFLGGLSAECLNKTMVCIQTRPAFDIISTSEICYFDIIEVRTEATQ